MLNNFMVLHCRRKFNGCVTNTEFGALIYLAVCTLVGKGFTLKSRLLLTISFTFSKVSWSN